MKPQVLFVDDEASVLAAIRRLLRKHGHQWDVHLVDTAEAALTVLGSTRIDVLVTDMRMPGTDGVALLEQARHLHPGTARLVLSGHADPDAILAAAGPTQQFLSKPCDPARLEKALTDVLGIVRLMDDQNLRDLFGAQANLPKPPDIYHQLTALAGAPQTTVRQIAAVVEQDVATSTEVLKLVNSSFFGLATDVTTIERAVSLLGLDVVQALVLAGSLFTSPGQLPPGLDAHDLSERATKASLRARRIAQLEEWDTTSIGQISLAALLHDVGLLVLATGAPNAWNTYRATPTDQPDGQRQRDAFGCTIGRASAYLLGLWGFATPIVAALANQPLDLDDPETIATAPPAELLVAYAHQPTNRITAPENGYLDPTRFEKWAKIT